MKKPPPNDDGFSSFITAYFSIMMSRIVLSVVSGTPHALDKKL